MSNSTVMYTQEELDIALLKQKTNEIDKSISLLYSAVDKMQSTMTQQFTVVDKKIDKLEQHMMNNHMWTLRLICGMYALAFGGVVTALGHSFGWF